MVEKTRIVMDKGTQTKRPAERWESGLIQQPGTLSHSQGCREFESHSLRQILPKISGEKPVGN